MRYAVVAQALRLPALLNEPGDALALQFQLAEDAIMPGPLLAFPRAAVAGP